MITKNVIPFHVIPSLNFFMLKKKNTNKTSNQAKTLSGKIFVEN